MIAQCAPAGPPPVPGIALLSINVLKLLFLTLYAKIFIFREKAQQCFCRTLAVAAT